MRKYTDGCPRLAGALIWESLRQLSRPQSPAAQRAAHRSCASNPGYPDRARMVAPLPGRRSHHVHIYLVGSDLATFLVERQHSSLGATFGWPPDTNGGLGIPQPVVGQSHPVTVLRHHGCDVASRVHQKPQPGLNTQTREPNPTLDIGLPVIVKPASQHGLQDELYGVGIHVTDTCHAPVPSLTIHKLKQV